MVDEPLSTKEIIIQQAALQYGPELFETVQTNQIRDETIPEASEPLPSVPACFTQEPGPSDEENDLAAIMVRNRVEVPRWRPGSVLKYTAWRLGYDTPEDADHAALHLRKAADAWNDAEVGVTFEYVDHLPDANFVICHKPKRLTVKGELTKAFFPSDRKHFDYIYVPCISRGMEAPSLQVPHP